MKENKEAFLNKDSVKLVVLPIIIIILELLPYGAVCKFAKQLEDGSITTFKESFSYFSIIPYGYGNFTPFITAILSCVLFLLVVTYILTNRFARVMMVVSFIAFIVSFVSPLIFGISYFSVLGVVISFLLAIETYFIGKNLNL